MKVAKLKPASGSLRLKFTISNADLGFEALYHELSELSSAEDRSRHVKRLLNRLCAGLAMRSVPAPPSPIATQLQNHPITFRLSSREVSLEQLYRELLPLPTTFARNQLVRRWLFAASAGLATAPAESAQPALAGPSVKAPSPIAPSSHAKQLMPSLPAVGVEAALRPDPSATVRKTGRFAPMLAVCQLPNATP
jgi:hypothetical protein